MLAIAGDDGVAFDLDALQAGLIREELEYGGVRLRGAATLSGARIAVVVDIGFGDSVEPGLETIDYPGLGWSTRRWPTTAMSHYRTVSDTLGGAKITPTR